jgi:hypothetical protein
MAATHGPSLFRELALIIGVIGLDHDITLVVSESSVGAALARDEDAALVDFGHLGIRANREVIQFDHDEKPCMKSARSEREAGELEDGMALNTSCRANICLVTIQG